MLSQNEPRPSVFDSWNSDDEGGVRIGMIVEGTKNPRRRPGYHRRRTGKLRLLSDEKLSALEEVLKKVKWDVVEFSEIRRRGEEQLKLKSGHLFDYIGKSDKSEGGVEFIVQRRLAEKIIDIKSVSARVIHLTLKINSRYKMKIIQAYPPPSASEEDEIEMFYDELGQALRTRPAPYTLLTGDFNAKIGRKKRRIRESSRQIRIWREGQKNGSLPKTKKPSKVISINI